MQCCIDQTCTRLLLLVSLISVHAKVGLMAVAVGWFVGRTTGRRRRRPCLACAYVGHCSLLPLRAARARRDRLVERWSGWLMFLACRLFHPLDVWCVSVCTVPVSR